MSITIKQARIGLGATQQEVADAMNIHVQTYAGWEKHPEDICIKDAFKLAEYFRVNFSDLIFLPTDPN